MSVVAVRTAAGLATVAGACGLWWGGGVAQASPASCFADRSAYHIGETVKIACRTPVVARNLTIRRLNAHQTIAPRHGKRGVVQWRIPASASPAPYGLFSGERYLGFFRVLPPDGLAEFRIGRTRYRGVDVLTLDGGMSAEYVVEKAGENLLGGVSHSWKVSAPGHGPRPVLATPDFLSRSVVATTRFYDDLLGREAPIESVILSTGIPSIPYIAHALGAPVLPLHFLVSADSVREIETVLDTAQTEGAAAYSTLSHDPSVDHAVAWIKLLDLPPAYRDFLRRHRVKMIYIIGSTNTDGGETASRRILERGADRPYAPGSIYIMYPATSKDDAATLRKLLFDIDRYRQDPQITHVADWESGITDPQVEGIGTTLRTGRLAKAVTLITSRNLSDLYDLGTFATAALFRKNGVKSLGFIANPYLIAHPTYEYRMARIPIVYWQGNPSEGNVTRFSALATSVRANFLPALPATPAIQLNLSRNFGGFWAKELADAARAQGWQVDPPLAATDVDETWDPEDGMTSISERIARTLAHAGTPQRRELLDAADVACFKRILPKLNVKTLLGPEPRCLN